MREVDPPVAKERPVKAELNAVRADSAIAEAVPGDSTLVERLMDCSKLPDSVTGVKAMGPTGTDTLVW